MVKTNMLDVPPEIGAAILRHRITNNLTQREMAERLGVSPKTVGRWERSEVEPWRIVHWYALAEEIPDLLPYVPEHLLEWEIRFGVATGRKTIRSILDGFS